MQFIVLPGGSLHGEVVVAGDKSISHRAVILGAISQGITTVSNFLYSEDCLHTLSVCKALGVQIEQNETQLKINGVGLHGLRAPDQPLDFGNAGTGIRLVCGLLAGQNFSSTLQGDASLNQRPMKRVVNPLRQMGAKISGQQHPNKDEIFPPLVLSPVEHLTGIEYALPVPSAQIKSCLLLAGLYANGTTTIIETKKSRDHSERMLAQFGAHIETTENTVKLTSSELKACHVDVPNDISSAAFFLVGAAMHVGSHILLKNVGINPTRMGVVHILREMGAQIEIKNIQNTSEPTADIEVKGTQLRGIEVPQEWVVDAIDEFPILFVAASCAKGRTIFKGLHELRVKESDRIAAMSEGLKKLGVTLETFADGVMIQGSAILGGELDSFGDHRVAMALTMASLFASAPIIINDCGPIKTSFPQFSKIANTLGLHIEEKAFEEL